MGLFDLFRKLLGGGSGDAYGVRSTSKYGGKAHAAPGKLTVDDLADRLGVSVERLRLTPIRYRTFTIPKRSGGTRTISAPEDDLKKMQRRILHRLLARLKAHPAAMGFERGRSIVHHAALHRGRAVVVSMDIRDYFPSTTAERVFEFFRGLGWDKKAAIILRDLCTHEGGLPQGAPTSPRLSNVMNYRMDARLAGLAGATLHDDVSAAEPVPLDNGSAVYSRYADDITFSFDVDDRTRISTTIMDTKEIIDDFDYALHQKKKLRIRRRHQQQRITGLVVNDTVNLPRATRRKLRAIEHRLRTTGSATMTESELAGWRALQQMIERQRGGGAAAQESRKTGKQEI